MSCCVRSNDRASLDIWSSIVFRFSTNWTTFWFKKVQFSWKLLILFFLLLKGLGKMLIKNFFRFHGNTCPEGILDFFYFLLGCLFGFFLLEFENGHKTFLLFLDPFNQFLPPSATYMLVHRRKLAEWRPGQLLPRPPALLRG